MIILGHNEKEDLRCVIKHLIAKHSFKQFVLWGRSMGAISALLYLYKYQSTNILGAVYDSPYADLKTIAIKFTQK